MFEKIADKAKKILNIGLDIRDESIFDWDIQEIPIAYKTHTWIDETKTLEKHIDIEGYKAIVRNDNGKTLGVVTNRYQSFYNHQFDSLCHKVEEIPGAKLLDQGTFKDGKIVWAQYDSDMMPSENINPDGTKKDKVTSKLLLTNGHAGEMSLSLIATTIRVVCQNTFIAAHRTGDSFARIRHTKSMEKSVWELEDTIEGLGKATSLVFDEFIKMRAEEIGGQEALDELFHKIFPRYNKGVQADEWHARRQATYDTVMAEYAKDINLTGETHWGLFNAITSYVDHHGKRSDFSKNFGAGHQLKMNAYKELTKEL